MASTRNKNCEGEYSLQQRQFHLARTHVHAPYGKSYKTSLPELGANPSHLPRDVLSGNPVEIESKLFGIGATNLVTPAPTVFPQLKTLPTHKTIDRLQMIMPKPLVTEPDQRPNLW